MRTPEQPVQAGQTPLWLLDVDGVLNAVVRRPDRTVWPDWRHGTAHADGVDWPIWFSPTVAETVARLHTEGRVEVRWLTTWGSHANGTLRDLLGLPEFEVAAEPPGAVPAVVADPPRGAAAVAGADRATISHGEVTGIAAAQDDGGWWKLRVVQRIAGSEPGRPVIWTDDDLPNNRTAVTWAEHHLPHRLLLGPRPTVGLTPRQLRAIRSFC